MPDKVELRSFQLDMVDIVRNKLATCPEDPSVFDISAGSGKTRGWVAAVNAAYRDGLQGNGPQVDGVVVLVPRLSLQEQAESDVSSYIAECSAPVISEVIARGNIEPLTHPDKFGYISTYQSLVMDSKNAEGKRLHSEWALQHFQRFILVLDEAQFLGIGQDDDGTKASQIVQQLSDMALHTIVLTGTPTRSDGNPIILARYAEPDKSGKRRLLSDVRFTYGDGVGKGYLRPCHFITNDGNGTFSDDTTFDIVNLERRLSKVLRHRNIWEPMVDRTIEQYLIRRSFSPNYRCLIGAIDQSHAEDIFKYTTDKWRGELKSILAISSLGDDSQKSLEKFRPKDKRGGENLGDILVSVAMAYIGYDCPSISVVGVLTNRRWRGWLEQFIMRGGRMWKDRPIDEQYLVAVIPNDPLARNFVKKFRDASEEGLLDREMGGIGGQPPPPDKAYVLDATLTGKSQMGFIREQDASPARRSVLEAYQSRLSSHVELTVLNQVLTIFESGGVEAHSNVPGNGNGNGKSYKDRRAEWSAACTSLEDAILKNRYAYTAPYKDNKELYVKFLRRLKADLNEWQGVKGVDFLTELQWEERVRKCQEWASNGRA